MTPTAPAPALRPTPSVRANTPTGAAHSTQRTMAIIASAIVSKNSVSARRRGSASRVTAKPKNAANTTRGRMASSAAALIGLVGAKALEELRSPKFGVASTSPEGAGAPARSASAPACASDQIT